MRYHVYECECVTPYDKDRDFASVYGSHVYQLIFKNCISPDGVTLIGTKESIESFCEALDESELVGRGFYEWQCMREYKCEFYRVMAPVRSCLFCEHCTDVIFDYTHGPYMFTCVADCDTGIGMNGACESFSEEVDA